MLFFDQMCKNPLLHTMLVFKKLKMKWLIVFDKSQVTLQVHLTSLKLVGFLLINLKQGQPNSLSWHPFTMETQK